MKKFLSLSLSLLLLLSLCACHETKTLDAFEMPESFDTSREYEISFWAKNDTNVAQVAIYEQAIAGFEKLYPNIHITMRRFTDYKKIYSDVITNIPTLTTPNVCISYPDNIATYKTGQNIVVPLDSLIQDSSYGLGGSELLFDGVSEDELVGKFYDECRIDGETYALPFMRSSEALYINKDYVEKLGYTVPEIVTWDWIWEVSEAALAKNEDGSYVLNGGNIMIPFIYKSTDNMMISMLAQLGADYSNEDGDILIFNETTKEILKTVSEHAASGAFSTFGISSYPGNYFNKGQCIFAIDSTAGATWIGTEAPNMDIDKSLAQHFETVVRIIPQYDTEDPLMISQGPSLCIFNKEDPQEVLASWLFVQYLLTDEIQIGYSQTEGYIPVTNKALQSDEYREYLALSGTDNETYYDVKIAASMLVIDNIENTFVTPVFNGSASLRDAAGSLIEEAAYAPKRKITVDDEYLEELFSNINTSKKLDQLGKGKLEKKELGDLPAASVILLAAIACAWIIIAIVFIARYNKNKPYRHKA